AATCFSQKTVVFSMLAPVSNRSSKNAEIRISQQVWGLWSAYKMLGALVLEDLLRCKCLCILLAERSLSKASSADIKNAGGSCHFTEIS
ncbi:hypothetical protein, partial [Massilia mucilaginosa]|uniref:hypothetical protein n=1 Tax=Massilia mucilaginosa TaxID=2609282 RepID=UPI001CB73C94